MVDFSTFRKVLLFGGSFDPPHRGHLELPERARHVINADLLLYIPAAVSPFKTHAPPIPAYHRVNMLQAALAHQPHAALETLEIDRAQSQPDQPSYTVDTLRTLRARAKEQNPQLVFRLLIGTDQMKSFHRWREHELIEQLAEPVVMVRPPEKAHELLQVMSSHERDKWQARLIDLPEMDVSSSQVRQRVAAGLPIDSLVPEPVARYIHEQGLYTSTAE